jgi:hypothetical protein
MQGYAVVQKTSAYKKSKNFLYRGIDRTVPWSQEKYDEGWDDPIMRGYTDTNGLIPNIVRACEALRVYAEIEPADNLEILYGSVREGSTPVEAPQPCLLFLGFDVASSRSPFYSIVGDFGPEPPIQGFLIKLNQYGLFRSSDDATSFLETYRCEKLADYDFPLVVWALCVVE